MTITTCPKCGSMNITTAGTCANCGWSQFAQVTVSSGVYKTIGELEIKVTGKALLDDYRQLLFENDSLTARIAELEKDNDEFRQLIRDWSIVLEQDDRFQLWHVESVRQAMLEINKEREE